MQPILMLAIVGVAAVALGTGFLNNNIELWIQEFGVGSGDIETPVDHVQVDFNIEQRIDTTAEGTYKNVIDMCEFTLTEIVGNPFATSSDPPVKMTCKITGHDSAWQSNGEVIAEGVVCAPSFGVGSHDIPLGVATNCPAGTIVLGPEVVDVRDAGDVIVVVQGNTYSGGDHTACLAGEAFNPATGLCQALP